MNLRPSPFTPAQIFEIQDAQKQLWHIVNLLKALPVNIDEHGEAVFIPAELATLEEATYVLYSIAGSWDDQPIKER